MSTTVERAISPAQSAHAGYRTLWRWHFYAGLFVMPFLVVLAITGTLYCFQPQIEPLLYPHRLVVEPRATPRLDADTLLASARTAMPAGATPVSVQVSTAPDRSAEYVFRLRDGSRERVREPVRRQRARHAERREPLHADRPDAASQAAARQDGRVADGARRVLDLRDDRHRHRAVVARARRASGRRCAPTCRCAAGRCGRTFTRRPASGSRPARSHSS